MKALRRSGWKCLREAHAIAADDAAVCKQIGLHGLALVPEQATIIHHCNTGSLATADYGTALGVIRTAHEHGKRCMCSRTKLGHACRARA